MAISPAKPPIPPVITLIVGVIGVSTGAIFVRFADAPALVTAAWRVGLAVLILFPITWWMAKDELRSLTRRDLLLSTLSGLFLALHFATWIASLDYTPVANSVVLVNTIPIWVGLLSPFITKERVGRGVAIGIVFSVAGAAVIGAGDFGTDKRALFGDGLAVLGAIFASFYILLGRNLRRRLSLLPYVTVCYGAAALILLALVLAFRLPLTGYSTQTLWAFAGLAVVSQCLGHTSYNWALKWFSAGFIAIALLCEPIGSTILAYFILGESLTWLKALGSALILWGIYQAASKS
jgi:drug/metabolite transporter (DMT)-like permease